MPNVSIPDQLRNIYLARAFDLEKVKTASAKNISKILDDLMREIVREVYSVDPLEPKRTAYQQERLNKLFNMADQTIKSQYKGIAGTIKRELMTLAEIESIFAVKAINSVLKVDMLDYPVSREVLERLVDNTLIEGAPSADWWASQSIDLQNSFKRVMRTSVARGETLVQMRARIMGTQKPSLLGVDGRIPGVTDEVIQGLTYDPGILKKAKRNAEALARSSFQAVSQAARDDVYKANSDVIAGYEFYAVLDTRTTAICRAYDGATWDLDGRPIRGTRLPIKRPPVHWGCRSTLLPIMKTASEILGIPGLPELPKSTRSSLTGQVSSDTTFNGWMKGLSEADQIKILGKQRQKLWASGKLSLADMINPNNNKVLTLKQLKEKTVSGNFWSD